jgi:hypothetical protein
MRIDVGRAAGGSWSFVAVDRRMHDRMIDERYPLLAEAIPSRDHQAEVPVPEGAAGGHPS